MDGQLNRSLFGKLGTQLGSRAASIRSGILTMAGLALFTVAGFDYSRPAGLGAAAFSCLALDWYFSAPKAAR